MLADPCWRSGERGCDPLETKCKWLRALSKLGAMGEFSAAEPAAEPVHSIEQATWFLGDQNRCDRDFSMNDHIFANHTMDVGEVVAQCLSTLPTLK